MTGPVEVHGGRLRVGDHEVSLARVLRLEERYGRWTGRAWLALVGTPIRLQLGPGYGAQRRTIREHLGDRPFSSDWMDGRFPGMPGGLPPDLAFALAGALIGVLALVASGQLGASLGLAIALLAVWPLGRLRDGWVVRTDGLRGGPPWAALVPWYDIDEVVVRRGRRRAWIWTRGRGGGQAASLPIALLPAFRARVRRVGGLDLRDATETLDDRYQRWRAPALGIPWGIGAGTLAIAWSTPTPWTTVIAGASAMAATALLGAMVTLRASGWGTGGVAAGTLLYGLLLLVGGLVLGGWIGGA